MIKWTEADVIKAMEKALGNQNGGIPNLLKQLGERARRLGRPNPRNEGR